MKELKLIDRVLVEIRNDENASQCQSRFVAEQLRKIADLIEDGYTGRTWMADEHTDVSWEREKRSTGFKIVSNKSLISQYYYHSEPAPRIISEELADDIRKFNMDYEENEQTVGEDIETKTNYLCDAVNLLAQVEQETKIVL